MKIVVLTKRQYMRKDLLDDRYGRFWEIPQVLAARGHQVRGFTLSYEDKKEGPVDQGQPSPVTWASFNAGKPRAAGLWRFMKDVSRALRDDKPDIIWACSDSLYVIAGARLAKRHGALLVADLYDNFEAYDAARIPFVIPLFHQALRRADLITVVSDRLRDKIQGQIGSDAEVRTLVNGIPDGMFRPMNKADGRRRYNIPLDAPVLGCTGILTAERDGDFVLRAYQTLRTHIPDLHLLIAGARDTQIVVPDDKQIIDCGAVPQADLARIISSMDLAVIANNRTAFSEYTFPQRLYETLACGVPVLASQVGAVQDALRDYPACLFEPGNMDDFVSKAQSLLTDTVRPEIPLVNWPGQAGQLEGWMTQLLEVRGNEPR